MAVPERVSVLGFDDIVLGELSQPPLSTVHIPMHMLGPEALHLLERRIVEGPVKAPARRVGLGCEIIKRASVAVSGR